MRTRNLRRAGFAAAFAGALGVWLMLVQPRLGFDPLAALREAPGARFWLFFAAMWALCGGLALGCAAAGRPDAMRPDREEA